MIIGFTGKKGSGKDSAAYFAPYVKVYRFADPLKDMLRAYLRYWDVSNFDSYKFIEGPLKEMEVDEFIGKTPRHAMVSLGTEWGRNLIHENLWIEIMKYRLSKVKPHDVVVIPDLRFGNEALSVLEAGGKIIKIVRPGLNSDSTHISETEMDTIIPHHTIINDGTIEELQHKVRSYLGV